MITEYLVQKGHLRRKHDIITCRKLSRMARLRKKTEIGRHLKFLRLITTNDNVLAGGGMRSDNVRDALFRCEYASL